MGINCVAVMQALYRDHAGFGDITPRDPMKRSEQQQINDLKQR